MSNRLPPHRFPPLRPPVETRARTATRASVLQGMTFADLCLAAALVLSVALALI